MQHKWKDTDEYEDVRLSFNTGYLIIHSKVQFMDLFLVYRRYLKKTFQLVSVVYQILI